MNNFTFSYFTQRKSYDHFSFLICTIFFPLGSIFGSCVTVPEGGLNFLTLGNIYNYGEFE